MAALKALPTDVLLLSATLAALLSGPALYAIAQRHPALLSFLDGFVLVSIAGLVLLEVVPDAFTAGGWLAMLFLLLGLLGPTALEHGLSHARREAHLLALGLAILGLILHSVGDGAALSGAGGDRHEAALGLAIAIHSIPVGLMVWWLLFPVFGIAVPALALIAMCAATVVGYYNGLSFSIVLGAQAWAWFQALIAGSILHVIFGRPHLDEGSEHHQSTPPFEGLGNLAAIGALAWLALSQTHTHGADLAALAEPALLSPFFERLLQLGLETAPALLLAYVIGGFISGELPEAWLRWLARGNAASQALRGMAIGLPLPICSCGVLPLYRSLIQRGVPVAAAMAFLIATPEVGVTALFISVPLLGWEMTALRVLCAAALAVFVAWMVARKLPAVATAPAKACPHCHPPVAETTSPSAGLRLRRAARSGLIDLVDDTAAWITVGLLLAAAAMPHVSELFSSHWPAWGEVLLFAVIGLPVYVCSAGATPLVAVLIAGGVSPGAAIAFLLTGPATNVSTFGVLSAIHGRRIALLTALFAGGGAVALGLLVNAWAPAGINTAVASTHVHSAPWYQSLSLIALVALFAYSLLRRGGRALFADLYLSHRAAA
ncbi:MAG: permease [Pseudomonadota bacterium]|nr:permease [Pseudomonadota bacterium]